MPVTGERAQVHQVDVPAAARTLSTLDRVDYEDAFRIGVPAGPERSGEEWARATFEGASGRARSALRQGWAALGLKLDRGGSDRFVLGWELRHSDAAFALLGCGSRIGMPAELLFEPEPGGFLFATFVQQDNPVARGVWAAASPRHREIVPRLLGGAAGRAAR